MAGYDPSQPRDEEGKWTEAENAAREAAGLASKSKIRELKARLESGEDVNFSEIIAVVTSASKEDAAEVNALLALWQEIDMEKRRSEPVKFDATSEASLIEKSRRAAKNAASGRKKK